MSIAQGWYQDPWDASHLRWWDGAEWTPHQHPRPAQAPAPTVPAMADATPAPVATIDATPTEAPAATPASVAPAPSTAPAQTGLDLRQRIPAQCLLERLAESHGLGRLDPDAAKKHLRIDEGTRTAYLSVLGERAVAQQLAGLPSGWTVLHSVPVGASTGNIDHVVIGPAGVFTINVRHFPGAVVSLRDHVLTANGQKQHCLTTTAHEAARTAQRLSETVGFAVPVTPAVVFVEAKKLNDDGHHPELLGVQLWQERDILRRLGSAPQRLDPHQVAAVTAAAVHAGTWHARPRPQTDTAPLVRDFEVLGDAVVRSQKRTRLTARLVAVTGSAAALAGIGYLGWPYLSALL